LAFPIINNCGEIVLHLLNNYYFRLTMTKQEQIGIRLTTAERIALEKAAKQNGQSITEYVKRCVEEKAMHEKRKVALQFFAQQKKAHDVMRDTLDTEFEKGGELEGADKKQLETLSAKLYGVLGQVVDVLEKEGIIPPTEKVKRKKK